MHDLGVEELREPGAVNQGMQLVEARLRRGKRFLELALRSRDVLCRRCEPVGTRVGRLHHGDDLVLRLANQLASGIEQPLSRFQSSGVHLDDVGDAIRVLRHRVDMIGQGGDLPLHVHVIGIARDGFRDREHHLGDGLREDGVHLFRNSIGSGHRDLGRDGVLLLVRIVGDLRALGIVHVEAQHVAAEILGYHNRSVVLTAFRSVDRLLLAHDAPADLVVGTQFRDEHVTHVDAYRHEVAFVALVLVGNRNGEMSRVIEDVPARNQVVPREYGRHDDQANRDDGAHDVGEEVPQIALE